MANEFELMRKRVREREKVRAGAATQQLERQFARIGGVTSGALIKQTQLAQQAAAEQAGREFEDISVQEAQVRRQEREAERQRQFLRGERIGAQEFARGERLGAEQFRAGERLGAQEFARGERIGAEQFRRGERIGAQEFTTGERLSAQEFARRERGEAQSFQAGQTRLERELRERLQGDVLAAQDVAQERQLQFAKQQSDLDRALREAIALGDIKGQQTVQAQIAELQESALKFEQEKFDQEVNITNRNDFINMVVAFKNAGIDASVLDNLLEALDAPFSVKSFGAPPGGEPVVVGPGEFPGIAGVDPGSGFAPKEGGGVVDPGTSGGPSNGGAQLTAATPTLKPVRVGTFDPFAVRR